jgi:Tfp pilus assembly major pilin PilA
MVVVGIMSALASIATLNYRYMVMKSRVRRAEGELSGVNSSLEMIRANHTVYPHCTPQAWLSIEVGKIHYNTQAGCNGASADAENTAGLGDFYSLFQNMTASTLYPIADGTLKSSPCGPTSTIPIAYIFNISPINFKILAECFPGSELSQIINPGMAAPVPWGFGFWTAGAKSW